MFKKKRSSSKKETGLNLKLDINNYAFILILILIFMGLSAWAIHSALNGSQLAILVVGVAIGVGLTSVGHVFSLFHLWISAKHEERRFNANLRENLSLMGSMQRVQNDQNSILLKQVKDLSKTQPEALPSPDEALVFDSMIFDSLEGE
jgi:hypothetical protein